jgi:hypothetical protein
MNLLDVSFVVYLSTSRPSTSLHPHLVLIGMPVIEGCVGCLLYLGTVEEGRERSAVLGILILVVQSVAHNLLSERLPLNCTE